MTSTSLSKSDTEFFSAIASVCTMLASNLQEHNNDASSSEDGRWDLVVDSNDDSSSIDDSDDEVWLNCTNAKASKKKGINLLPASKGIDDVVQKKYEDLCARPCG